jgi:hypothetical protein
VYLRDLICVYTPTRSLRSEETKHLKRPKTNCEAGNATFPAAAPDLWNSLFQYENYTMRTLLRILYRSYILDNTLADAIIIK